MKLSIPTPSPSELMNRFGNEVLNNKNLSAIDEIAAEDYVELDLLPGQAPGREGLKAFLASVLFPAFPDQRWVVEEQITEGDKVVSRFTMYGTHRADFMGIPATGRSIAVKGVVIDRVVNGKWKDSRLLMDNLSLLQQLGARRRHRQTTPHSGVFQVVWRLRSQLSVEWACARWKARTVGRPGSGGCRATSVK